MEGFLLTVEETVEVEPAAAPAPRRRAPRTRTPKTAVAESEVEATPVAPTTDAPQGSLEAPQHSADGQDPPPVVAPEVLVSAETSGLTKPEADGQRGSTPTQNVMVAEPMVTVPTEPTAVATEPAAPVPPEITIASSPEVSEAPSAPSAPAVSEEPSVTDSPVEAPTGDGSPLGGSLLETTVIERIV